MAEGRSIVFLGQQLMSFFDVQMTDQKIVVVTANQLYLNGFRYECYALMIINLIYFFITIGILLLYPLGLAVGLLQLLQSKLYITNTGFIRFFISKLDSKQISKTLELW